MRALVSQRAAEQLAAAPDNVARTFFKQLAHLLRDRNHPSLDAKKYPESGDPNVWQGRITKAWRFYFRIDHRQRHGAPKVAYRPAPLTDFAFRLSGLPVSADR